MGPALSAPTVRTWRELGTRAVVTQPVQGDHLNDGQVIVTDTPQGHEAGPDDEDHHCQVDLEGQDELADSVDGQPVLRVLLGLGSSSASREAARVAGAGVARRGE